MEKSLIIGIVLLIVLIGLVFSSLFSFFFMWQIPPFPFSSTNVEKYSRLAIEKRDPSICNRLATSYGDDVNPPRKSCYSAVSLEFENITIYCNWDKFGCDNGAESWYMALAEKKQDVNICKERKPYSVGQCITNIAIEANDSSYCEYITGFNDTKWDTKECYYRFNDEKRFQNSSFGKFLSSHLSND